MATYDTFDFPYHRVTHSFPAGDQTQFGRGWMHAAEPDRPLQRTFVLKYNAMLHIKNPYTGVWLRGTDTRVQQPEQIIIDNLKRRSIWAMNDFYDAHLLHKKFYYTHFVFGQLVVRFNSAFQMPDIQENVNGIYDNIPTVPFELSFIECPE